MDDEDSKEGSANESLGQPQAGSEGPLPTNGIVGEGPPCKTHGETSTCKPSQYHTLASEKNLDASSPPIATWLDVRPSNEINRPAPKNMDVPLVGTKTMAVLRLETIDSPFILLTREWEKNDTCAQE